MRTTLIIVLTIFLLALGLGLWFFLGTPKGKFENLPFPVFGIPEEGGGPPSGTQEEIPGEGGETPGEGAVIRLKQIFANPVSGFLVFEKQAILGTYVSTTTGSTTPLVATTTVVRLMEQETGHIFEHIIRTGQTRRLTNTTIPRAQETIFSRDGARAVARYINERDAIETFTGRITPGEIDGEGNLTGVFLEENIETLVASPSENRIFYLAAAGAEVAGIFSDATGENKRQIFRFPFTEWLIDWGARGSIILSTKPSGLVSGYAYELNQQTGALSKILGNIIGLTVRGDPRGERVLVGEGGGRIRLSVLNRSSSMKQELSLETLPEKCSWAATGRVFYCAVPESVPAGIYPDVWYQGQVLFRDALWKIAAEGGAADFLISLGESSGTSIDVVNPMVDVAENYIVFKNKKDGSLWSYEIEK